MAVTIRDVAKYASVSVSTVSRALNEYHDISPETRKRVLKAAEALGYSPNISARNLSSKRKQNIGLVISDFTREYSRQAQNEEFTFGLMLGAYRCAADLGLEIAMYSIDSEFQKKKSYEQFCAERNLSGVLLFGLKMGDDYIHQLQSATVPCVTVDTIVHGKTVGSVSIDNIKAFQELTQYLFDLGHRRLVILAGKKDAAVTAERTAGLYEAYQHNQIPFSQKDLIYCDFREKTAYQQTLHYLRVHGKSDATAFLCMSDMMAIGAMKAIKEMGYQIPDDFSVVGYDGINLATYLNPSLTTIDQQIENKGYEALKLLFQMMESKEDTRTLYLPYQLVIRESSARRSE